MNSINQHDTCDEQNSHRRMMDNPAAPHLIDCRDHFDNNGIRHGNVADTVVKRISTNEEFDDLRGDWLRLHEECESAGLFTAWYWSRLWWQYYGEGGELYIITVSVDNVVRGIAPLYRCQTRAMKLVDVSTLRFIGSGGDTSPDDLDLLYGKGFEELVVESVCRYIFQHSVCTRLQLSDLPVGSCLVTSLLCTAQSNHWGRPAARIHHRHVDTLPASVNEFEKNLSKNARKQRRRRRRKLHSAGTHIEFKTCETAAEIDSAFVELSRVHHARHTGKGGSDSFQSEKYQRFHLAVMNKALENDELRLMQLIIDGKIVAIEYAFLCNDVLSFFQTGFDPSFHQLSPGHLLMMEIIDRAIEDGAKSIDLLKGDYEYKQTYAKKIKTTIDLDLWRSPFLALIKQFASAPANNDFQRLPANFSIESIASQGLQ